MVPEPRTDGFAFLTVVFDDAPPAGLGPGHAGRVTAAEALAMGLTSHLVPADEVMAAEPSTGSGLDHSPLPLASVNA